MQTIHEIAVSELVMHALQHSFGREAYELRAAGEIAGTIHFNRLLLPSAEAAAAEGAWTFRHEQLLGYRITALDRDTGAAAGDFVRSFTVRNAFGGTMRFARQRSVRCLDRGTWANLWDFAGEPGGLFVRMRDGLEAAARIEITASGMAQPDIALLIFFGWYLRLTALRGRDRRRRDGERPN